MNHFDASTLGQLLEPDLALRITLTLGHFLWQGVVLGFVAFVADRCLRAASARTRYWVFVGILLVMAAAPAGTYLALAGRESKPVSLAEPAAASTSLVIDDESPADRPRVDETLSPPAVHPAISEARPVAIREPSTILVAAPTAGSDPVAPRGFEFYAPFVVTVYVAGFALMLIRLAIALEGGRRLRLAATPIPDGPIAELVLRQAKQLGLKAAPLVAWCSRISVPVVVGIVRPMILLPSALATGFDPSQLEALVTHELAHIRRFDPLVNLLQRLIEVVLFFHPAVWYVSRCVSAERENACDDLVLSAGWPRIAYADALLRMAERSAAAKDYRTPQAAGAALAASGSGASQLGRRVLRLLEISDSPRMRLSRGGVLLLAGAAILVVFSSPLIHAVANKLEESKPGQQIAQVQSGGQPQAADSSRSAAESETLARVFAAWKERQAHARSFHVTWQTRMTAPRGGRFSFGNDLMVGLPRVGPYGLKEDIDLTFPQSEFWGEGKNDWRRDFPHIALGEMGGRQFAQGHVMHVGNVTSRLEVPVGNSFAPWMTVLREDAGEKDQIPRARALSPPNTRELNLAPLRFALRPLSDWSPEKCRVVNENADVYGVHCIEIRKEDGSEACWVDPKRGYVVVFCEQGQYYRTRSVFIEYQRSPANGWVPSRWTWEERENSGTGQKIPDGAAAVFHTTVTRYDLNQKLSHDPFTLKPPAGTLVYDLTPDREVMSTARRVAAVPSADDRKTIEAIKIAWSQRQSRFKSFRFTSRREPSIGMGERRTIQTACGDGNKFALEIGGTPSWQEKTAFDGSVTRSVWFSNRRGVVGNATIKSGVEASVFNLVGNKCLWLGLCPLETPFGRADPSKFRVVSHTAKLDGTLCAVVETEVSRMWRTLDWVDPAREYVILREDRIFGNVSGEREELSYRLDSNQGWIPAGWKHSGVAMRDELRWGAADVGTAGVGMADTVTDYRINQPIPPAVFHVDFPEGVSVQNIDAEEASAAKARTAEADAIATRWAAVEKPAWKAGGIDPEFNARNDIDTARNSARTTGKRVLIEFGVQGLPDCRKLYNLLKNNAQLSARVRTAFVLVLVDMDYPNNGMRAYDDYVPKNLGKHLPALCALEGGDVLNVDDTTALKTGDDYDVAKLSAYLEKWSPHK